MIPGTREKLLRAFLKLGEEKPYAKITVTEIVERAGITRKTFYYHFEDIFALGGAALEMKLDPIFEESRKIPEPKESLKHFLRRLGKEKSTLLRAKNSPYYTAILQILVQKLQIYLEQILDEKKVLDRLSKGEAEMCIRILCYSVIGMGLDDTVKKEKDIEQELERFLSLFKINFD